MANICVKVLILPGIAAARTVPRFPQLKKSQTSDSQLSVNDNSYHPSRSHFHFNQHDKSGHNQQFIGHGIGKFPKISHDLPLRQIAIQVVCDAGKRRKWFQRRICMAGECERSNLKMGLRQFRQGLKRWGYFLFIILPLWFNYAG